MSDLIPEIRNSIKISPKERQQAIQESLSSYQERLQRAVNTSLDHYGFTPEEQELEDKIYNRFKTLVEESGSESDVFLRELDGVTIVRNSVYLKYLKDLRVTRGRFSPGGWEMSAAYVTQGDISNFLEKFLAKLPEEIRQELRQVGKNGSIFLGDSPSPLEKWHEGAHAIQHIEGWSSKSSGKPKTEIGVNIVLLGAHNQGILGGVTAGDYFVTVDESNKPRILPKINDIYKELQDFERNVNQYRTGANPISSK